MFNLCVATLQNLANFWDRSVSELTESVGNLVSELARLPGIV